jgi:hypothetical protein
MVPCSMFCETESEFQIAARTRDAGCLAFRRAPQPRPRSSLIPCTGRSAAVPSSLQPLIPRLQHPWPPCGGRLIANLELEFPINPIRITKLQFSNRKFLAILSFPIRAAHRESQASELLIENARLRSDLSGKDSYHLQISNRERIGFPVPPHFANPARYQSPLPISKPPISNLRSARRIRDTCNDIPSLRAFLRCYASCGSRRKSE